MLDYTNITECRLCKSPNINTVLDFGEVPLANSYPKTQDEIEDLYPLTVVRCDDCLHIQLKETVNPSKLFSNYSYSSSDSPSIVEHFKNYATQVSRNLKLNENSTILEIGSNDGVLLKEFVKLDFINLYGVEPATNIASKATGCGRIFNAFFDANLAKDIRDKFGPMDVICSNNTFAHIANLDGVVEGINTLLADEGVFVFENAYLMDTMKGLYFDQCLPPGQPIITNQSFKNIENIEIGDEVLTHLNNYKKVTKVFKNKYEGKIYTIKVYGQSSPLILTPAHPVYILRNGKKEFIEAQNIKKGDKLLRACIPEDLNSIKNIDIEYPVSNSSTKTTYNFNINENLCKIFGYYLSEGHYYECTKGSAQVDFSFGISEKEKKLAKECCRCLKSHGAKSNLKWTKYGWHVTTYGGMARILKREFGTGAFNKNVPAWIFNLNNNLVKILLESYMKGDGYIYRKNKYWRISTISPQLAQSVSLLANKLGFSCSINIGKVLSPRKIANNKNISILKYPPIDILIKFKSIKKIKVYCDGNYQYGLVKSMDTQDYNGYVYNLTVEDDNSYTTLQSSVHNCYHEHIQYYGFCPIIEYLDKNGFKIFNIEHSMMQGGSFRIYCQRKTSEKYSFNWSVINYVDAERVYKLYDINLYKDFENEINVLSGKMSEFFKEIKKEHKTVACYGCPAKFALFSKVFKLNSNNISYVVDDSPLKQGLFSPGGKIPIVSGDIFHNNPPDYCIISAWNMADSIIKRNPQFKGKWVIPMPKFKIQ